MIRWALTGAWLLAGFGLLFAATARAAESPAVEAAPPSAAQILAVPADLQTLLREQVIEPARSPSERMQRLVALMSDGERGLGMQYRDEATYTISEGFQHRQANCVTYTLMFLTLARAAGLEAYPQEIEHILSWRQQGDIVYRSNHVNAGVRVAGRRYTVDVGRDFVIAWRPAQRISEARALAQYYNNRAAMLLEEGKLVSALAHADAAIRLDPAYATTWSNAGVMHLRNGDAHAAEQAYLTALKLDPGHAGALFNLVGLYQRTGDRTREARFRQRLEETQQSDPFHQVMLALDYENRGDGPRAVARYRRAIHLYSREHRFHAGLARACLITGDTQCARRALQRALALSDDDAARADYRALLSALAERTAK